MQQTNPTITNAEKRIWIITQKIKNLSFAEKLAEKAAEGVDVRILVSYWWSLPVAVDCLVHKWDKAIDAAKTLYLMEPWNLSLSHKVAETHKRIQTMKEALRRNLKAAIMPSTEMHYDLYIVDETVFSDVWNHLDVRLAETWFMEHWNEYVNKSPIFKLFGSVVSAEKRIWIAMRRAGHPLDANLFVRRAAEGVDVRIIVADNSEDLVETINYYAGVIEDRRRWMAELIVKSLFSIFNREDFSYIKETIEEIKADYGDILFKFERSLLKRNLNVIKAPVMDEFFIIDDKAWINQGGELKEVDVKEVEGKFVEILNEYQPTADHKA